MTGGLRRTLLAGLAVWAAGSCGDGGGPAEPAPPVAKPGQLVVGLASGSGAAALRFRVSGGEIGLASAADPGHRVFTRAGGDVLDVVVFGDLSASDVLRFEVPDVGRAESYSAVVLEAAGADNGLLAAASFGLSIRR